MGKVSMIQGLELEEVDWTGLCLVMSIQMSSLDDHFSYYENVEQMVATRWEVVLISSEDEDEIGFTSSRTNKPPNYKQRTHQPTKKTKPQTTIQLSKPTLKHL